MTEMKLRKGVDADRPPLFCVYGVPGAGKTKLATDAIHEHGGLVVCCEDGLSGHHGDVNNFGLCESYEDVKKCIGYFAKHAAEEGWKVLAVDGLDRLLAMMETSVCQVNGWKKIEDGEYGKGRNALRTEFQTFLHKLVKIRNALNVAVFLIGHHQAVRVSPPDADPYMQYALSIDEKMSKFLIADCDVVAFATYPIITRPSEEGFGKKTGRAKYRDAVLRTKHSGANVAKWRGDVPESIPLAYEHVREHVPFFKKGPTK